MTRKFTFIHEYGTQRISVEIDGDSCLSDVLDTVETFLVAAGFHRDAVTAALGNEIHPAEGEQQP